MLLEDVEGRHPDLRRRRHEADAVRAVVREQARALTRGSASPLGDRGDGRRPVRRWHRQVVRARSTGAVRALPAVVARGASDVLLGGWSRSPTGCRAESWCHLDVRDDNLLLRADGTRGASSTGA